MSFWPHPPDLLFRAMIFFFVYHLENFYAKTFLYRQMYTPYTFLYKWEHTVQALVYALLFFFVQQHEILEIFYILLLNFFNFISQWQDIYCFFLPSFISQCQKECYQHLWCLTALLGLIGGKVSLFLRRWDKEQRMVITALKDLFCSFRTPSEKKIWKEYIGLSCLVFFLALNTWNGLGKPCVVLLSQVLSFGISFVSLEGVENLITVTGCSMLTGLGKGDAEMEFLQV